jgi:hypothetical protein
MRKFSSLSGLVFFVYVCCVRLCLVFGSNDDDDDDDERCLGDR